MSSFRELLAAAKAKITEVDAAEAAARLAAGAVAVDVREGDEWASGAVASALHVPRGQLESQIEGLVRDKHAALVVYCAGGARSAFAARTLAELGYTDVVSLAGGFEAWKGEGLDWAPPPRLEAEQRERYERHLRLPEIGTAGQLRLRGAKVLLVGAGGLGSPAAMYLAAAGVGTLGVVDMDVVDASNLQRQLLHDTSDVGRPKVESAAATIRSLNPDVTVVPYETRSSHENVLDVLEGWDVVVDGADNFPTRYLLNDASVKLGIPVVHGSVYRFEGQVSVFDPRRGPTYRDHQPTPPPDGVAPSCAEAGVLGVLPGIIGTLQAIEAVKLLLDLGDTLVGRLLVVDALAMSFLELRLRVDPDNPVTWDRRDEIEIVEMDDLCRPNLG